MAKRGRRPAGQEARKDILDAAARLFAESSYDAVSLRAIAREASVDPALVHHYFGSKGELFVALMTGIDYQPLSLLEEALSAPVSDIGATLVSLFLRVWDDPEIRPRVLALLMRAGSDEPEVQQFRSFIFTEIWGRLAQVAREDDVDMRVQLTMSTMLGMAMARYVWLFPDIAEASAEELVRRIGPTVQRYLRDDIPGGSRPLRRQLGYYSSYDE